ncbi:hypothetical protein BK708_19655 [Bacillus thuringiensis serovar yunnanensis]|nr:hypothetical protein BK708_19655 [Bacillus thuringiensis serovar yunnanensis]
MEFLTKLEETEDSKLAREKLSEVPFIGIAAQFRMLKGFVFGEGIKLSIQASYGHYCTPRETLDLNKYERMEVALLKNDFVTVEEVLPDFPSLKAFEEFDSGGVYGYVPIELIEELYQELKRKYGFVN